MPAAYCGLFSWRGQPGEPWIRDVFPLAPSFDTAGWLTRTLRDCEQVWETVYARESSPVSREPRGAYLPPESLGLTPTPPAGDILETAAGQLSLDHLGPDAELATVCRGVDSTYSVLQSTEAFAVHRANLDTQRENYGAAVWERIDRGRRWTSRQMDTARFHALRIRAAYDRYFADHDFLVTPVTLSAAPKIGEAAPDLRDTLLRLNTHVSIAGRPALTIPLLLPGGLSVGLQLVFPSSDSPVIPAVFKRCKSCFPSNHDSR